MFMMPLALSYALVVAEGAQDFTLKNSSQHDIDELHISEVNNDQWGADILGKDILHDGESTEINFKGYKDSVCKWDLKIVQSDENGHDGSTWTVEDVDLCNITELTFFWDSTASKVIYTTKKVGE